MPAIVPPLLSPYVSLGPHGSLTLVTSVLDVTSNWLLLRYVHGALTGLELADKPHSLHENVGQEHHESLKVVFVSILRDFEQWREMGKKVVCKLRLFCGLSNIQIQYTLPSLHFFASPSSFIESG